MRRARRLSLLCLVLALLLPLTGGGRASAAGTAARETVAGYYTAWSDSQGYAPEDIPAELLTQVNFAFAGIRDGQTVLNDPERDGALLRRLTALRERNAGLKIVLSVGGWDDSAGFSDAASSPESRERFAQSCAALLREHGLDGVDLDWEYPVSGGAPDTVHRPQDRENFTLLLKALRQTLDRQSRQDGRDYLLTIAGAVNSGYLNAIEPQAAAELVDHVFLMAYDFHGPWDDFTDLNAPLHTTSGGPDRYRGSVDSGVSAWLAQGVPAEKLVLGMPLYGYIYQGVSGGSGGLYQSFDSARSISWDRVKANYLTSSAFRQFRHEEAQTPYLYGNGCFLSYDDGESIAAKAELARRRGLGGVGFWELSQDRTGTLIQSARAAWAGGRFRDVPGDAWYAAGVESVSAAGLMNGGGDGTFSPGEAVTRGQLTAILWRLAGEPGAQGGSFSDIPASAYYGKAVAWAAERGIVKGWPDGTFRPDLPVSRQQFAAILWRYAGAENAAGGKRASLADYRDAGEISAYAVEPLRWALAEGILQGTKEGDLLPQGTAARGQAAVMLERFRRLLEKE